MRKSVLAIVIIILVVIFFVFYLIFPQIFQKNSDTNSGENISISSKISITKYYIPVVSLISEEKEISFQELISLINSSENPSLLPQGNKSQIKNLFGLNDSQGLWIPAESIIPMLLEDKNLRAILPIESVDFRVKTLKIDGVYLWDKNTDLVNYPLQYSFEVDEKDKEKYYIDSCFRRNDKYDCFNQETLTKITATGEIILSRGVAERIRKYTNNFYPFLKVKELLEPADLTISTLEAPMSSNCVYQGDTMVFCGQPEYLEGLTYSGIDFVSMAANHIKDYGKDGIEETINLLDERNIGYTGAGLNFDEAHKPWIKEINGVKFGFLGYNDVVPTSYAATVDSAGSAWANIEDIKTDIAKLRSQVDVLVVMNHWGIEYTNQPSDRQKEIAYATIDAGADLIVGGHPHWVQGVEFYNDKFIFYGIGNFVFDQMWSEETKQGTILDLTFYNSKLVSLHFQPTIIEDYAQPRLAGEEESKIILNRIWEKSVFE